MLRVLFRCDAGPAIGLGHAMRCLALAEALGARHGAACAVLTRTPEALGAWVAAGSAVLPTAVADPVAALRAVAWQPDLVVVDLPVLGAQEARALGELPWPVVLIDDEGQVPVATRFLVNGNAFATALRYRVLWPGARLLRGPRYVALRSAVVARRPRRRVIVAVGRRVLLTLGGSVRPAALEQALAALPAEVAIDLVLGPWSAAPVWPGGRAVTVHRAPADLATLLVAVDVCVAAGGSTLYEAACLGTPTVALPQSPLEARNAAALAVRGAVVDLGADPDVWRRTLGPTVSRLLADAAWRGALARAGRRLVDGRGAARLADALVAEVAR